MPTYHRGMETTDRQVGSGADLTARVGIITGAASGIGLATARAAARLGARLAIADLAADGLEEVAASLRGQGAEVVAVAGDLTQEEHLEKLAAAADDLGPLDFAINVAGIGYGGPVAELDLEGWRRAIDINLTGCFLSMKHELRAFARLGRPGSIVNVSSSVGASIAIPGAGPYAAAKAGVVMLSKCAALEVGAAGVRVNVVAPGGTETPFVADQDPEMRAGLIARHPLGRFGSADEIAEAAIWLASDAASFVTGTVLSVDGGFSALSR